MTKDNAAQYLPLVKALSEGKMIQHRFSPSELWRDVDELGFNNVVECYRIKPEPREFWIVDNGQGHCQVFHYPISKSSIPTIHVREVIP